MIKEVKNSSERQWGNHGKLGFVPTSKEIVEAELKLIDFSEVISNDFPFNICDLSGGEGDQLEWTNQYFNEKGIMCQCYYNELATERYKEGIRKYPHFNALNTDFFRLKIGCKENRNFNRKVFSVCRNNPPYAFIERHGLSVRAEMEFFLNNSLLDVAGGIHIMEVPLHQLMNIQNFISVITYRYEVFIAKFPRGEFEKYKQVALIMKKKHNYSHDKEIIDNIKRSIVEDTIPYLDEVQGPVFKVTIDDLRKSKNINIFRENKVTEKTLNKGLNDVLDNLLDFDRKQEKPKQEYVEKPLVEHLQGHVSQLLASGAYDGLMNNLLVKGASNKEIKTEEIVEEGKRVVIETEVLKPCIEITNANGDIIFKDF